MRKCQTALFVMRYAKDRNSCDTNMFVMKPRIPHPEKWSQSQGGWSRFLEARLFRGGDGPRLWPEERRRRRGIGVNLGSGHRSYFALQDVYTFLCARRNIVGGRVPMAMLWRIAFSPSRTVFTRSNQPNDRHTEREWHGETGRSVSQASPRDAWFVGCRTTFERSRTGSGELGYRSCLRRAHFYPRRSNRCPPPSTTGVSRAALLVGVLAPRLRLIGTGPESDTYRFQPHGQWISGPMSTSLESRYPRVAITSALPRTFPWHPERKSPVHGISRNVRRFAIGFPRRSGGPSKGSKDFSNSSEPYRRLGKNPEWQLHRVRGGSDLARSQTPGDGPKSLLYRGEVGCLAGRCASC